MGLLRGEHDDVSGTKCRGSTEWLGVADFVTEMEWWRFGRVQHAEMVVRRSFS